MSSPTPNPDDHSDLRDALRRDAARIQEPPFDAALHHATMRRIRSLSGEPAPRFAFRWITTLAASAALLVITAIFAHHQPARPRPDVAAAIASSQNAIAQLSLEPTPPLPAWISPTASLLDEPRIPE